MITVQQAIDRLFATYNQYGITWELLENLFNDGVNNQGFTPLETYNLLRMSLGHEFNEREYFAVSEIASMLGMSEDEVMEEAKKAKISNETLINGFRLYLPNGIK